MTWQSWFKKQLTSMHISAALETNNPNTGEKLLMICCGEQRKVRMYTATPTSRPFLREGVSNFPFADYIYLPSRTVRRVPTVVQHFIDMQDPDPLPIWRPEIFVNCRYSDLTDEECFRRLELYTFHAKQLNQVTSDHRRPVIFIKENHAMSPF